MVAEISDSEQRRVDGSENKLWQARTDEGFAEETDVWVARLLYSYLLAVNFVQLCVVHVTRQDMIYQVLHLIVTFGSCVDCIHIADVCVTVSTVTHVTVHGPWPSLDQSLRHRVRVRSHVWQFMDLDLHLTSLWGTELGLGHTCDSSWTLTFTWPVSEAQS